MTANINNQSNPQITTNPPSKVWVKNKNAPRLIKITHWMYDHPKVRKAAKIAAYILGAIAIAAAALCAATFTLPIAAIAGLMITGVAITAITGIAARLLHCFTPMRHDMKNLSFRPEKLTKEGKDLGELYYDGLVPVLKINTSDPKEAGYAQGYLLQKAISAIRSHSDLAIFTIGKQKRPSQFQDVLNAVRAKIPPRFLMELEGIVEGYNAKKRRYEKSLSLDDLLYIQLMPDTMYFNPDHLKQAEAQEGRSALNGAKTTPKHAVACSLLGLKNQEGAPMIARTMDWQSFGVSGTYSLIISRLHQNGTRTAEVGIPGLAGTLTGVNNRGVSVAMNVTGYPGKVNSIEGLPASIYNRMILEECTSFDEAQKFADAHQAMGPYHLTVSDATKSGTFSFYQKDNWTYSWNKDKMNGYRLRLLEDDNPLVTTNCSCTPIVHEMFNSRLREMQIASYLSKNDKITNTKELLKNSQTIPWVNNHLTTHRVIMGHKTLEVAFDNAFAGERDLHAVDLEKLF